MKVEIAEGNGTEVKFSAVYWWENQAAKKGLKLSVRPPRTGTKGKCDITFVPASQRAGE